MTTYDKDEANNPKGYAKIIEQAYDDFRRAEQWEATARNLFLEDLKFAEADSDNGYQWPAVVSSQRGQRPCLTINKVRQHNLQILNDSKMNKPGIKIRPVGDESSYKAAETFEGIIRHIEYISNAQVAYETAQNFQVKAGKGYCRVITDYEHEDTFNQEIFIRPINEPMDVYLDPDIQEKDGSDARFVFIFKNVERKIFEAEYPNYADYAGDSALDNESQSDWYTADYVRVAEYYKREEKWDTLYAIPNPKTGAIDYLRKSKLPKEILDIIIQKQGKPDERPICDYEVTWYKIVGSKVIESKPWPGKYIPVARFVGEEVVIQGVYDCKGHTRALKDAQRMYNYNASAAVEYGALQTKAPWVAPAQAIEGFETYWDSMNDENYSIAPYNHMDDAGNPIPAPERAPTPESSPLFLEGMATADQQMMMASGQYEANLGRKSNEVSGKAIDAREHQGDQATQHFNDNQAIAIRYIGKIVLDLIPKIYDTKRVKKIQAEDGDQTDVTLDPNADQAHLTKPGGEGQEENIIFNPNVGKYDVVVDTAPSYLTKRMETFNALSQIITSNEPAFQLLGDMWAKNSDFAEADKIAERMERMLPEQAKGGPSPEMMKAQEQIQVLTKELSSALEDLSKKELELKDKDDKNNTEFYKAITDRLAVIEKYLPTSKTGHEMLHEVMINEQTNAHAMAQAQHQQDITPDEAPAQ